MASSVRDLARALRSLGVREGEVLVVHSSFRAIRPVEDGPAGLIRALKAAVGPEGTLVLPSWTGDDDTPFDPEATPVARSLGVVPETFRTTPGVVRSRHPLGWAAVGPDAHRIVGDPLPIPPYVEASPLGRVVELDGKVLLLGVGHDCDTMVHVAEHRAGVPYGVPKHVTAMRNGRPVRIDYLENDHCCARFALVGEWLDERGLQARGPVGHGEALLARARDVVDVVVERLEADPLLFLHEPDEGCADCDEARASVG